ncbi:Ger(x)C family spore germination protein [Cohnella abietis]|uniref:Germination protein n=1 Tax=Cohnella abietis TaxID=2507935 RepID=A0A3T1D8Y3_9BACL|nr:Ger(x)C family spore germination protein [Cohnella abietis]BBI34505.1 germination protein [Cohnella abietis]
MGIHLISYKSKFLLLLGMLVFLIGCWDRVEINDIAIVLAAGIDQKEGGKVELSVQVFVPSGKSSKGMSEGGDIGKESSSGQTLVSSALGISLADAMAHLQENLSRRLFWGHDDVYIFGEERARAGITEDLDFLLKFAQMRERANVYVSKGKAINALRINPQLERSSAEIFREISKSQVSTEVTLKDIINDWLGQKGQRSFFVPLISNQDIKSDMNDPHSNSKPYYTGAAVFKEGKMVGDINSNETRGILWLNERIKTSILTFRVNSAGSTVSMNLSRTKVMLIPHIQSEDMWTMDVVIRADGDVIQNTSQLDLMKPSDVAVVETGMNNLLRGRIEDALEQAQHKMRADIIGFGDAFRRKYPKQWRKASDQWDERFSRIHVNIQVQSHVLRPGTVNINTASGKRKANEE